MKPRKKTKCLEGTVVDLHVPELPFVTSPRPDSFQKLCRWKDGDELARGARGALTLLHCAARLG